MRKTRIQKSEEDPKDEDLISNVDQPKTIADIIKQSVEKHFGTDRDSMDFELPAFSEFHRFKALVDSNLSLKDDLAIFDFVVDSLSGDDVQLTDNEELAEEDPDVISGTVLNEIESKNYAETIALVSLLTELSETDMDDKLQIISEQYASFDELRRMAALCRLIVKKRFNISLLDEFEESEKELYEKNCERIVDEKRAEITQLSKKADGFVIAGEFISNKDFLLNVLRNNEAT